MDISTRTLTFQAGGSTPEIEGLVFIRTDSTGHPGGSRQALAFDRHDFRELMKRELGLVDPLEQAWESSS